MYQGRGNYATYLYESFSYSDTVEVKYGLTARDFNSFKEASKKQPAEIEGGIHYRPAIDNGVDQGIEVENYCWKIERMELTVKYLFY